MQVCSKLNTSINLIYVQHIYDQHINLIYVVISDHSISALYFMVLMEF